MFGTTRTGVAPAVAGYSSIPATRPRSGKCLLREASATFNFRFVWSSEGTKTGQLSLAEASDSCLKLSRQDNQEILLLVGDLSGNRESQP